MIRYELIPNGSQKSFNGKAIVELMDDGTKTLYSYGLPVVRRLTDGKLVRLYDGYTATTGKHIKVFCGLSKQEYLSLELNDNIKL